MDLEPSRPLLDVSCRVALVLAAIKEYARSPSEEVRERIDMLLAELARSS